MSNSINFSISGQIVDLHKQKIFPGTVVVEDGRIKEVREEKVASSHYIMPGLIDAHIHIESSMLIPSEFAKLAVLHGTVATVSDPHEIANVLGIDGIKYMIANGKRVPFKFFFGASSCVPATPFETAGFAFKQDELEELLAMDEIKYLSEMMNFPGVINRDAWEMEKIAIAKKHGKPVDGHAPGVLGEAAQKYASAGITTDHECFTMEEAIDKIKAGMKIQIREGSAAKNFEALIGLMENHADKVLFCSDDKHPDDLVKGHINQLVVRAMYHGHDLIKVLRSAVLNPIQHYGLEVGTLQVGDPADMIVVDNPNDFKVLQTYINGVLVADQGKSLIDSVFEDQPNNFSATPITTNDIRVIPQGNTLRVIEAYDGQLVTGVVFEKPFIHDNNVISDPDRDILKLVVLNRYLSGAKPAVAFIRNFNLKGGAIASSVAHDSHNIVAVGTSDEFIVQAINNVIAEKGGVTVVNSRVNNTLPLPVAGLMSTCDGYKVAHHYYKIDEEVHKMGSTLRAPFMTLSFMALLVIPQLKLSDKGLFDGNTFSFTDVFAKG
ncbi:MAG: adenine deaminase [Bacteroidetes bacterium]|nr:adenine deaminase [Bacteroidota bacterium]